MGADEKKEELARIFLRCCLPSSQMRRHFQRFRADSRKMSLVDAYSRARSWLIPGQMVPEPALRSSRRAARYPPARGRRVDADSDPWREPASTSSLRGEEWSG